MGFIQTWKMIKDEGAWAKWDWTVKADIDAIIIPMRLRSYLEKVEVTDNGIYLENCKYVNYGFFGSLAVVSHDAAYDINTDASCAAWRPEGEKKNGKWKPNCALVKTP